MEPSAIEARTVEQIIVSTCYGTIVGSAVFSYRVERQQRYEYRHRLALVRKQCGSSPPKPAGIVRDVVSRFLREWSLLEDSLADGGRQF